MSQEAQHRWHRSRHLWVYQIVPVLRAITALSVSQSVSKGFFNLWQPLQLFWVEEHVAPNAMASLPSAMPLCRALSDWEGQHGAMYAGPMLVLHQEKFSLGPLQFHYDSYMPPDVRCGRHIRLSPTCE